MTAWLAPCVRVEFKSSTARLRADIAARLGAFHPKPVEVQIVCMLLSFLVAFTDYLLGPEISPSTIYALPVLIAAWFVGMPTAIALSVVNVTAWLFLNHRIFVATGLIGAIETGLIRFVAFIVFAAVLVRLNHLQKNLESLAEARAHALMGEAAERSRLEREMLDIREREQLRIGRDLHDGLCQHLAGTAFLTQLLANSLSSDDDTKKARAGKIALLMGEAVTLARGIVKGLHPIELQPDGLMQALEEHAATTSRLFAVRCRLRCSDPVFIHAPATAAHLFRIAQEAVANAIRHGRATDIAVELTMDGGDIRLCIGDNGTGFSEQNWNRGGIGLRSMATRTRLLGGRFSIASSGSGGAVIVCIVPGGAADA